MIRLQAVRALPVRHVAGLMTGTSMDGLDIALCRIVGEPFACETLAFETVPFPDDLQTMLRDESLQGTDGLARLDMRLGHFFADALEAVLARHPLDLHLIGSHGQTVYHEHGVTTLQLGEPSVLALRFGCPVVSDFRRADIAAGGCGAPLVPYVDARLLARPDKAVLAVNIGGIANLTAVPRLPFRPQRILGMDCGPGNMILDQLARLLSGGALEADCDGALAARGRVREDLLATLASHRFFASPPPRSAGREQFGEAYVRDLLALV
jgi:anhydro-N-acetylmuramic acid kinase